MNGITNIKFDVAARGAFVSTDPSSVHYTLAFKDGQQGVGSRPKADNKKEGRSGVSQIPGPSC